MPQWHCSGLTCIGRIWYNVRMDFWRGFVLAALLACVVGCQSYTIVQRNVFVDDDGNVVVVEYGRSESEHVNTFVAPTTGKEMEFRSKLMVRAELPDGKRFTAWQCMNFLARGTMYKTDDEEWMLLANGFSCIVYRQTEEDETRYLEVYRGVLCDTPESKARKKDERWKVLPNDPNTYRKAPSSVPRKRK